MYLIAQVSVKEQDSVADSLDELESGSDCEVSKVTSTIARCHHCFTHSENISCHC